MASLRNRWTSAGLGNCPCPFDRAFANKLEFEGLPENAYVLAFLRRDAAQMKKQAALTRANPESVVSNFFGAANAKITPEQTDNERCWSRSLVLQVLQALYPERLETSDPSIFLAAAQSGKIDENEPHQRLTAKK